MEKTTERDLVRIAIVGPESTGKTTLAMQLAEHYNTVFVPEFAREYLIQINRPYTLDDIVAISKGQIQSEDEMTAKANRLLICDTDMIVTKIWAEHAFACCPEWIANTLKERKYNLRLLCNIDIPWVPDPQREHPHLREHLLKKYQEEVARQPISCVTISGSEEARKQSAIKTINGLLKATGV